MPKINFKIAVLLFLLGIFFLRVYPAGGSRDTYYHLSVGRQVWQEKKVPHFDNFTYSINDNQYISTEWLSGLFFYAITQLFGLKGLLILRLFLGVITMYIFYKTLKLFNGNDYLTYLFITLVGFVLAIRLNDRPEMFSFAIFSYLNFICINYFYNKKLQRTIALLPIMFILWSNLHPFFTIGLAFIAGWLCIFLFENLLFKKLQKSFAFFSAAVFISLLACLIQYKKLFLFFLNKGVKDNQYNEFWPLIHTFKASLEHSLTQISVEIYIYFVLLTIYLFLSVLYIWKIRPGKLSIIVVIYYFLILLLPFAADRLIPLSLLFSTPILYYIYSKVFVNHHTKYQILTIKIFLFILVIAITYSIIDKSILGNRVVKIIYKNERTNKTYYSNRLWRSNNPTNVPKFINTYLKTKHLFTTYTWNDYLIWHSPSIKVFSNVLFDPMDKLNHKEQNILTNGEDGWEILLEKYKIDTIVNTFPDPIRNNQTPIYKQPNWKLVYLDDIAIIYARNDIIIEQPLDLSAIHPEKNTILKFSNDEESDAINQLTKLIDFHPQNAFGYDQLILYYSNKDIQKAKIIADQARAQVPNNPKISIDAGLIYSLLHYCNQSKEYVDEAIINSFNDFTISIQGKKIISECQ